jgi:transposase
MPRAHPPEFRQRAIERARQRDKPLHKIAEDLGIAPSCLRRWVAQADVNQGRREGLTTGERAELVRLRRENRVQATEIGDLEASCGLVREWIASRIDGAAGVTTARHAWRSGEARSDR